MKRITAIAIIAICMASPTLAETFPYPQYRAAIRYQADEGGTSYGKNLVGLNHWKTAVHTPPLASKQ